MSGLIGKKLGMTSIFDTSGRSIGCTVIEAGPCFVTQIKESKTDGYKSIQNKQVKIFLDLKYHDIPATVEKAIFSAANLCVSLLLEHTS